MTHPVHLAHRAVVTVTGPEAEPFLQGLLTQAAHGLALGERRYGALLTPQGKIIADLLFERSAEGFLLDVDRGVADAFVQRLNLFRLRSKVVIARARDLGVAAYCGAPDPRSALAPPRAIAPLGEARRGGDPRAEDVAGYHAARIAAGLAEQGIDFAAEEVFPADINMDLIAGIDFKKGCFVGQEVVSRMKRRGTARRRTLACTLASGAPFPPPTTLPTPVFAGASKIGLLTSSAAKVGLVRLRLDQLLEARQRGAALSLAPPAEGVGGEGDALLPIEPSWFAAEAAALSAGPDASA